MKKTFSIILLVIGGICAFAFLSGFPKFIDSISAIINSKNPNDIAYYSGVLTGQFLMLLLGVLGIIFGLKMNKKSKTEN